LAKVHVLAAFAYAADKIANEIELEAA